MPTVVTNAGPCDCGDCGGGSHGCADCWARFPQLYATIDVPCFGTANQGSFPLTMSNGLWSLVLPEACGVSEGNFLGPGLAGVMLINRCEDGTTGIIPPRLYFPYLHLFTVHGYAGTPFLWSAVNYYLRLVRDDSIPIQPCWDTTQRPTVDMEFDVVYDDPPASVPNPPNDGWAWDCCFNEPNASGGSGLPSPPARPYTVGKLYVTD